MALDLDAPELAGIVPIFERVVAEHVPRGTGFLVAPDVVVTCRHVATERSEPRSERPLLPGSKLAVGLEGDTVASVDDIVHCDRGADLMALRIDRAGAATVPLVPEFGREEARFLARDRVHIRGYPGYGGGRYAGSADLACEHLEFREPEGALMRLQLSGAMAAGFSGAPVLVESRGHAFCIGIAQLGGEGAPITEALTAARLAAFLDEAGVPYARASRTELFNEEQRERLMLGAAVTDFLAEYRSGLFAGRDSELNALDRWLAESGSPNYRLLEAPIGRGKSALLARWYDRLRERGGVVPIFAPISIRFGTFHQGGLLRSLASQLARVRCEPPPPADASEAELRELAREYMQNIPSERTVVILLDGLDEASGPWVDAALFPSSPPANLRVVAAARPVPDDADETYWLTRLGWEGTNAADRMPLEPLAFEAVVELLQSAGPGGNALAEQPKVARELHRLSQGDPLLLRLYVEELTRHPTTTDALRPEELSALTPGYGAFLRRWWEEHVAAFEDPLLREDVGTLLDLLACARGPLTRQDLVELWPGETGLTTRRLQAAVRLLERFIVGDGLDRGYVFGHPRLAEHFYEQLDPAEQAAYEQRFLAFGRSTLQRLDRGTLQPEQVPGYVLNHHCEHLVANGCDAGDFLLFLSRNWWRACEVRFGGYSELLAHIEAAWNKLSKADQDAIEQGSPPRFFPKAMRSAAITASIHSVGGQLSAELLVALVDTGRWDLPRALRYARTKSDPADRAESLIALAEHRSVGGTSQDAAERSDLAVEALFRLEEVSDGGQRAELLGRVVPMVPDTFLVRVLELLVAGEPLEWTTPDGLAHAIRKQEPKGRVLGHPKTTACLHSCARHMPPAEVGCVLLATQAAIGDSQNKADVLATLLEEGREHPSWEIVDAFLSTLSGDRAICVGVSAAAEHLVDAPLTSLYRYSRDVEDPDKRGELLQTLGSLSSTDLQNHCAEEIVRARFAVEKQRANILRALSLAAPQSALGAILRLVRITADPTSRQEVLTHLLPRLAGAELNLAADVVLELRPTPTLFCKALQCFLPNAPSHRVAFLVDQGLRHAQKLPDPDGRYRHLIELARVFPWDKATTAVDLAFEALEEVTDPKGPIFLLANTVGSFPVDHRERAADYILRAAERFPSFTACLACKIAYEDLPAEQQAAALQLVRDRVSGVEEAMWRIQFHCWVAERCTGERRSAHASAASQEIRDNAGDNNTLFSGLWLIMLVSEDAAASLIRANGDAVVWGRFFARYGHELSASLIHKILAVIPELEGFAQPQEAFSAIVPFMTAEHGEAAADLAASFPGPSVRGKATVEVLPLVSGERRGQCAWSAWRDLTKIGDGRSQEQLGAALRDAAARARMNAIVSNRRLGQAEARAEAVELLIQTDADPIVTELLQTALRAGLFTSCSELRGLVEQMRELSIDSETLDAIRHQLRPDCAETLLALAERSDPKWIAADLMEWAGGLANTAILRRLLAAVSDWKPSETRSDATAALVRSLPEPERAEYVARWRAAIEDQEEAEARVYDTSLLVGVLGVREANRQIRRVWRDLRSLKPQRQAAMLCRLWGRTRWRKNLRQRTVRLARRVLSEQDVLADAESLGRWLQPADLARVRSTHAQNKRIGEAMRTARARRRRRIWAMIAERIDDTQKKLMLDEPTFRKSLISADLRPALEAIRACDETRETNWLIESLAESSIGPEVMPRLLEETLGPGMQWNRGWAWGGIAERIDLGNLEWMLEHRHQMVREDDKRVKVAVVAAARLRRAEIVREALSAVASMKVEDRQELMRRMSAALLAIDRRRAYELIDEHMNRVAKQGRAALLEDLASLADALVWVGGDEAVDAIREEIGPVQTAWP